MNAIMAFMNIKIKIMNKKRTNSLYSIPYSEDLIAPNTAVTYVSAKT
jgi:hypothetical protein